MKRALLAVGAALLLGAATFATSVVTASSADARPGGARSGGWGGGGSGMRGMGGGGAKFYGGGGAKFYGGGGTKVYSGGPSKFSGPVKYSGVKFGGPGKHHFIHKPGKHHRFVKHRFHRPFFVGAALYSYGYYDECVRWHPAYGWINVCYPYDY